MQNYNRLLLIRVSLSGFNLLNDLNPMVHKPNLSVSVCLFTMSGNFGVQTAEKPVPLILHFTIGSVTIISGFAFFSETCFPVSFCQGLSPIWYKNILII